MHLIDYTHPGRVPALRIPLDRRSAKFYRRLTALPAGEEYASTVWEYFHDAAWLEGASAWYQATQIAEDAQRVQVRERPNGEIRLVVGSDDLEFDDALAQALWTLGWHPMVAEVRRGV